MKFPTCTSGVIPGDPHGRTYAELDHWYRQHGTSLRQQCYIVRSEPVPVRRTVDGQFEWFKTFADRLDKRQPQKSGTTRWSKGGPTLADLLTLQELSAQTRRAIRWHLLPEKDKADYHKRRKLPLKLFGALISRLGTRIFVLDIPQRASHEDARRIARLYDFKSVRDYKSRRPPILPNAPTQVYKEHWKSWGDYLGYADHWEAMNAKIRAKKRALLRMTEKPRWTNTDPIMQGLATFLSRCTNPERRSGFDPEFNAQIRAAKPHWFVNDILTKKQQLLQCTEKPSMSRKAGFDPREYGLAAFLSAATSPKSRRFDSEFNAEIRKAKPRWFLKDPTVEEQKKTLLGRVKKPSRTAKRIAERRLRRTLWLATKHDSKYFDPTFNTAIRKKNPYWFVDRYAVDCKRALLRRSRRPQLAKKVSDREKSLARFLHTRISPNSETFDAAFAKEIREEKPHWFPVVVSVAKKKRELLRRAEKPIRSDPAEQELATTLSEAVRPVSPRFDPEFNHAIRKAKPHWFKPTPGELKRQLLRRSEKPGTTAKSLDERRLRSFLWRHTSPTTKQFDPAFDKLIRQVHPSWFSEPGLTVDAKKQMLLQRSEKPSAASSDLTEHKLAQFLSRSTSPASKTFDSDFNRIIKKAKPSWFIRNGRSSRHPRSMATANQKALLDLARKGTKRPSATARDATERQLGQALSLYTKERAHTKYHSFRTTIKKLRPDWFGMSVAAKKTALLELAAQGAAKPKKQAADISEQQLANGFYVYTKKDRSSYDLDFDKLIRALRPDWFRGPV